MKQISWFLNAASVILFGQCIQHLLNLVWIKTLIVFADILKMISTTVVCFSNGDRVVCQEDITIVAVVLAHN